MADEIVFTEEQKAIIAKQVEEAKAAKEKEWSDKFQSEVNKTSAALRKKAEEDLKKATMTEAERLASEAKEEKERLTRELGELKAEKSLNAKKSALNEAKLPSFYANDLRLVNAKDEEVKEVLKTLSKEYNEFLTSIGKTQNQSTTPSVGTGKGKYTEAELLELAQKDPEAYRKLRKETLYGGK